MNVGWLRWLASFHGLTTLTDGQRLRNARKARVNSRTVGSLHGFRGHLDPTDWLNEMSGSMPPARAVFSQASTARAWPRWSATFQGGKMRERFTRSWLNSGCENIAGL